MYVSNSPFARPRLGQCSNFPFLSRSIYGLGPLVRELGSSGQWAQSRDNLLKLGMDWANMGRVVLSPYILGLRPACTEIGFSELMSPEPRQFAEVTEELGQNGPSCT